MVFGLFAICGYQFAPRLADLTDSRIWRMPRASVPAPLDQVARNNTIPVGKIGSHWPDSSG